MQIKINNPATEQGATHFRRITKEKDRKFVHQGGNLHLERIYASGGMVVSVFHNYLTNQEEEKYDSIQSALNKYNYMREMRDKTPEWVDEGILPAILKAVRAAQRQVNDSNNIVTDMGDPTEEDIERECGVLAAEIAAARAADPELDEEMSKVEKEAERGKRKKRASN